MAKVIRELVWYAAYGSNMNESRFKCYILGGKLPTIGTETKEYSACPTDKTAPRQVRNFIINRKMIFGLKSGTWHQHGVAFIGNKKDKRTQTFSKLYLISKEQFNHLFASENGRTKVVIDYNKLNSSKVLDFDFNFYNRLLLLEKSLDGHPIYTFTKKEKIQFNEPCKEYLEYLIGGIENAHKLTSLGLLKYFSGIRTGFSKKEIINIIKKIRSR